MQLSQLAREYFDRFRGKQWYAAIVLVLVLGFVAWEAFEWTVNRIYVPQGYSLLLRYKGPLIFSSPPSAQPGEFAKVDEDGNPLEVGMLERTLGPGRHFYCPIWWQRDLVPDQVVEPGHVAVVSSKLGELLSEGKFLVEGEIGTSKHKGILRKVYGPGRYRVNPYAYEFRIIGREDLAVGKQPKVAGWVDIPTGYVGVVTHLTDNPGTGAKAGIDQQVLQPGMYMVNPKEQQIDVIEIGYREKSFSVARKVDARGKLMYDASGEPLVGENAGGLSFPSNDGFTMYMDFTAIWGLFPDQAPKALETLGNVDAVENKIIVPQIESICRNKGSQLGAVDLLVGETRQKFQTEIADAFHKALHKNEVTLLYGLIRYIYIPQQVREPIQKSFIADELKLTRDQEQLTAKTEAILRGAERQVELEAERTKVETIKMVAKVKAEGQKKAEETKAKTLQLGAVIDKDTAELEAQATILKGQAEAKAQQLLEEAKAQKFELAVKAFGGGEAYNQWVFASGLPTDLKLTLFYAGPGTFWTDLKGFSDILLGRQAQQEAIAPKPTK